MAERVVWKNTRTGEWQVIPAGLKHVLVFGSSRVGKSSIINLMLGGEYAKVSPNVMGETFASEPYWNEEFCFWDTAGLNEQKAGTVQAIVAIKKLLQLIKQSKGFHAVIMVSNWQSLNDDAVKKNWDLFYANYLDKKIPAMICITGRGIDDLDGADQWLQNQLPHVTKLGFLGPNEERARTVVMYSRALHEISSNVRSLYSDAQAKSKVSALEGLRSDIDPNLCYNPVQTPNDIYFVLKKLWNLCCDAIPSMKSLQVQTRTGLKELLIKLGYNEDEALSISIEVLSPFDEAVFYGQLLGLNIPAIDAAGLLKKLDQLQAYGYQQVDELKKQAQDATQRVKDFGSQKLGEAKAAADEYSKPILEKADEYSKPIREKAGEYSQKGKEKMDELSEYGSKKLEEARAQATQLKKRALVQAELVRLKVEESEARKLLNTWFPRLTGSAPAPAPDAAEPPRSAL